jgi:pilus assembly protein CpaB
MAAKPKPVIIVGILAIVIAAVAAYFLYNYLKTQEEKVKQAVAVEKVVAASENIPIGTTINDKLLKIVDWPKANLPPGTFQTTEQVAGRIALQSFSPGDPIVESKLVPKEAPAGILSFKIPEGHRAITVGVDQVAGVAGFINPGNLVDVVITTTPPGAKLALSKIVLQNVPILAIGQIVDQKEGKPVLVPTVTMDVTPEDAEKLAIAGAQGRLQLVLRRIGDKEEVKTVGATILKVLSGATTNVSVSEGHKKAVKKAHVVVAKKEEEKPAEKEIEKPKETFITVDVFRGGQRTSQQFKVK